jgi:hypothetical protein
MEVPAFSMFLQTVSIPPIHLILLFLVSSVVLVLMELYKKIRFRTSK